MNKFVVSFVAEINSVPYMGTIGSQSMLDSCNPDTIRKTLTATYKRKYPDSKIKVTVVGAEKVNEAEFQSAQEYFIEI